jgi:hypothetical protein
LEAMSEWLLLAGDDRRAKLALVASRTMLAEVPQDHPFLQAVVRRDLGLTVHSLKRNLRLDNESKQIP